MNDLSPGAVQVRDVLPENVPLLSFAGGELHLDYLRSTLNRVRSGEVEMLVLWQDGLAVATGGIDFVRRPGAGYLWMLSTDPARRSQGLGTQLIRALESRALERGITRCELLVEEENVRAHTLYERLGYEVFGREEDSWYEPDAEGRPVLYECDGLLMYKKLKEQK
jgi:ribosomal protein S18 acetylase RimI-like enzyme